MTVTEMLLLAGFAGLVLLLYWIKEQRLADPNNNEFIPVDQMRYVAAIENNTVNAELIRQSGNSYKVLGTFQSPSQAFDEIEKSFKRARIESVSVLQNSPALFKAVRLHHSHGGKAEGKKLGGAIVRIAYPAPSDHPTNPM